MGKQVFFMFVTNDETKTFCIVEPLYFPYGHNGLLTTTLNYNLKSTRPTCLTGSTLVHNDT